MDYEPPPPFCGSLRCTRANAGGTAFLARAAETARRFRAAAEHRLQG